MSSEVDETSPLVSYSTETHLASIFLEPPDPKKEKFDDTNGQPRAYKKRWWILFVFCLCAANQAFLFIIWMPLSDALLIAYNWGVSDVGMASMTTCLTFVILALPVMCLVESQGIRVGVILANLALVCASILWCIALHTRNYWLMLTGSMFCGIAPTITYVLPSLLSVTWFPVSQRTTATSISILSINVGMAMSFVLGPQICGSQITSEDVANRKNLTAEYVSGITEGLQHVSYFISGTTTVGLILALAYFPAAPQTPPSLAQSVTREDFSSGLKKLFKNSQYWILTIAFNISNSTFLTWLPLISVGFRPLDISQGTAARIGTLATLVNGCSVLVISFIADLPHFKRKTKMFIKVLAACSVVLLVVIACIQMNVLDIAEDSLAPVLYILVIGAAVGTQSAFPLYSELACEYAFPVYEGLACTVMMMGNWGLSVFFYGLLLIPTLSFNTTWMTWVCVCGSFISLPLLMLLKDDFRRLELDESLI